MLEDLRGICNICDFGIYKEELITKELKHNDNFLGTIDNFLQYKCSICEDVIFPIDSNERIIQFFRDALGTGC